MNPKSSKMKVVGSGLASDLPDPVQPEGPSPLPFRKSNVTDETLN